MTTVTGCEEAIEKLRGIDVAMRGGIVRDAARLVATEAAGEMRTAAPTRRARSRSDAGKVNQRLRSQLGTRVRTYQSGAVTVALAGERSYRRGQRHGHLIEHGHRIVRGGTIEQQRKRVNRLTGEATIRTYVPRARKAERRGAGKVLGRTTPRPFMGPIITRYMGDAPEKLRQALATKVAEFVSRG